MKNKLHQEEFLQNLANIDDDFFLSRRNLYDYVSSITSFLKQCEKFFDKGFLSLLSKRAFLFGKKGTENINIKKSLCKKYLFNRENQICEGYINNITINFVVNSIIFNIIEKESSVDLVCIYIHDFNPVSKKGLLTNYL